MKKHLLLLNLILSAVIVTSGCLLASTAGHEIQNPERAKELKAFIRKEKPQFEVRESQRRDLLSELDKLNEDQNKVREKVSSITISQTELAMVMENISLEIQQQKELEQKHRQRLYLLLKVTYRIKKEGMLRFIFTGQDLSQLTSRVRVLYHTLRSQTTATKQLVERAKRLEQSEQKLVAVKTEQQALLDESRQQEEILGGILNRKKSILATINKKQNYYKVALREYKRLSAEVNSIFKQFKNAEDDLTVPDSHKGNFAFPVMGKIVQGFGKSVSAKFGTVIYHKGLEIEAEHNSPVSAVAPGIVEYSGWVRGLGNVAILHHGSGVYTLNAHLFKISKMVGSRVEEGEMIGTVGDTGSNEKPGLYFEIREKGKAVDPIAYFTAGSFTYLN